MKSLFFIWFLLGLYSMAVSLIRDYLYSPQKMLLSAAEGHCNQHYGHLASFTTIEEYQRAATVTGQSDFVAWIGLNRTTPHENIWQWIDGTKFNFTKWNPSEPDDQGTGEDCAVMKLSGWCDTNCLGQFSTICSRRFVMVSENKTWDEALRYCRNHYTDLVFVDSVAQLNLLKIETPQAQTASVWTGLRFLDGKWLWVNMMPLGNLVSLPSCPIWPYRCGAYNFSAYVWENRDCNEPRNFLCYH